MKRGLRARRKVPIGGWATDAQLSVPFLREVTATLNAHQPPLRFSTDVACSLGNDGWCPMIDNCALVASSGVNRIMHMGTYNAASYQAWVQRALAPAIAPSVPRASVGLGLGVWSKRSSSPSSFSRSLKRGAVHTRRFGGGREPVEPGPGVGQRADLLGAQPQLCRARPVHTLTGRPGPDQELSRATLVSRTMIAGHLGCILPRVSAMIVRAGYRSWSGSWRAVAAPRRSRTRYPAQRRRRGTAAPRRGCRAAMRAAAPRLRSGAHWATRSPATR